MEWNEAAIERRGDKTGDAAMRSYERALSRGEITQVRGLHSAYSAAPKPGTKGRVALALMKLRLALAERS